MTRAKLEEYCGTVLVTAVGCSLLACALGASNQQWFTLPLSVPNGGTGAATVTGLVKGNGASAMTAASAGTDYYAPSSTDVAVADGGTGASTAAGARTNLATNWYLKGMGHNTYGIGQVNPADSSVYYPQDVTMTPTAGHAGRIYVDQTGTVSAVRIKIYCGDVVATSEASTLAMSVNGGAYANVDTGVLMSSTYNMRLTTGLSQAVTAGDYLTFRLTNPAWATNPQNVTVRVEATLTY